MLVNNKNNLTDIVYKIEEFAKPELNQVEKAIATNKIHMKHMCC